jgi:hypothetical protein
MGAAGFATARWTWLSGIWLLSFAATGLIPIMKDKAYFDSAIPSYYLTLRTELLKLREAGYQPVGCADVGSASVAKDALRSEPQIYTDDGDGADAVICVIGFICVICGSDQCLIQSEIDG